MKDNDKFFGIDDPIEFQFDKTSEEKYLRELLLKLHNLSLIKTDYDFISVFYERYINKLPLDAISVKYNIPEDKLEDMILEMVRFINKD